MVLIRLRHLPVLLSILCIMAAYPVFAQVGASNTGASPSFSEVPLVLPGQIQDGQWVQQPASQNVPLLPELKQAPPAWSALPSGVQTNIPQGSVFSVALTSPLDTRLLRAGDLVEFQTLSDVSSSDGKWQLPRGTKVNARVNSLVPATYAKRDKLGFLFYELVTPDGWVIPFEGQLLSSMPSKNSGTPMEGAGLLMITPEKSKYAVLPEGKQFPVRVIQTVYYGPSMAQQARRRPSIENPAPDRGVVPVNYDFSHLSQDARDHLEQYQNESVMPLPYEGFMGDSPAQSTEP